MPFLILPAKLPSLPRTGQFLLCSLLRSIYLYLNAKFTANRDDCWYDGPIRHWKVANGRDGEYSLLNIEGCPSWLVERFRTFQNLSDPDCNFTKKMCWHLRNQQWNAHFENPKSFDSYQPGGVFQPISVASDRILRYCGLCNYSCHQYLACRSQKKTMFLAVSLWKPHLGSVDPSNSFFVATVFRFLINVSSPFFCRS